MTSDCQKEDVNAPGLVRYWFEFDLAAHIPASYPTDGTVQLDGDGPIYRLLWRGVGVTGCDEADCLKMLQDLLDEPLPSVSVVVRDIDVSEMKVGFVGNPAWRGVWCPPLDVSQPKIL